MKLQIQSLIIASVLLLMSGISYAAPLIIVPTYPLPTTILPGGTVDAYYTVSNNTLSFQNNVFVKKLPPHVTQVTNDPNFCGATFDLQAYNTPGSSCILKLVVSAPVNADPDDLLVCLRDTISCACTDYPLDVSENIQSLSAVTVGSSFNIISNARDEFMPLAYTSQDQGNHWQLANDLTTLPDDKTQGQLFGVSCDKDHCASVGFAYDTLGDDQIPLGYTSTDGGKNWSDPADFPTVASNHSVSLYDLACVEKYCTAVGAQTHSNQQTPISYISHDGGKNWHLSALLPTPAGVGTGALLNVTCENAYCVAVGYSDGANQYPIVYTSTDNGNHWTQSSALPAFAAPQGVLNGVTCSAANCVSVGSAFSTTSTGNIGLGYYSVDGGITWTLSASFPNADAAQPQILMNKVSCIGVNCNAIGASANNSFNHFLPVSYTSTTGGMTWLPTLNTPMPLPGSQTQGELFALICDDANDCMSGGASFTEVDDAAKPLSYFSQNMGANWQLSQTASSGFSLPSGQSSGLLNDMEFTSE